MAHNNNPNNPNNPIHYRTVHLAQYVANRNALSFADCVKGIWKYELLVCKMDLHIGRTKKDLAKIGLIKK